MCALFMRRHAEISAALWLATGMLSTGFLAGCGGGSSGGGPSITIADGSSSHDLNTGGTVNLTAQVTGTSSTGVIWKVEEPNGGTITADGVYTAPSTPGTYHIEAISQSDPSLTAVLTVVVLLPAGSVPITVSWNVAAPAATQAAG